VQQEVVVIYSALAVEREIEDCFLLNHETRHASRKKAPPLVLF